MRREPWIDASPSPIGSVGLGFRLKLADAILASETSNAQFLEIAPENYLDCGGMRRRLLHSARERFPIVSHGLCGDFAGSDKPDLDVLSRLKLFLREVGAKWYSDHLCLTVANGVALHDLLPLPFSEEAAERAIARIRFIQDFLEIPVAIENVSAYLRMPGSTMEEPTFVSTIATQADCLLLLDVNNVYVNSQNFGFDPDTYMDALPLSRVVQIHVAGHRVEEDGLLIDTHGEAIIDPVYALLERTLPKLSRRAPVLLERDANIPPLPVLEKEMARLRQITSSVWPAIDSPSGEHK
jgi:uncharacterized protein